MPLVSIVMCKNLPTTYCTTAQLVDDVCKVLIALARLRPSPQSQRVGLRSSSTDIPTSRTHPQLQTAQPALSPYPRLSRPQISKRVVLDRATTALRQNYYDMKTLLWSLPQRPMRAPVASARQQTHKGCWNVTRETTRRR